MIQFQMRTKGEGGQKTENSADVFYGCPLIPDHHAGSHSRLAVASRSLSQPFCHVVLQFDQGFINLPTPLPEECAFIEEDISLQN